jgi:hypothetical protein
MDDKDVTSILTQPFTIPDGVKAGLDFYVPDDKLEFQGQLETHFCWQMFNLFEFCVKKLSHQRNDKSFYLFLFMHPKFAVFVENLVKKHKVSSGQCQYGNQGREIIDMFIFEKDL